MTVRIREAHEAELDEIARVLRAAFEPCRAPRGVGVGRAFADAVERYLEDVVNVRERFGNAQIFIAVDDERIVGTGTLYPPGAGRRFPWPEAWASFRLLAVDSAHRRRGIGRMLIEARVERARLLGAPAAALQTSEEFAGSRRLVERLGWARRPEFDQTPAPGVRAESYVLPLR